ncbi:NAD(P)H-hydrate dehydratase [Candidatus Woesearchaeota archaeon]|nr:MAG: NAD(P)H-hydrate dehydratase [Candidatus Woesearchaeota archaeon]
MPPLCNCNKHLKVRNAKKQPVHKKITLPALKPRKRTSHKGQNGRILVIGGSEDYIGAPALVGMSAIAALRSGADLVTVAAPKKVSWAINCIAPDLITRKIPGKQFTRKSVLRVLELAKSADAIVIGNGITLTKESTAFMREIIRRANKPIIIDAAALRVIRVQDVQNAVLLPHAKELETLLKNSKLSLKNVQRQLRNNILVLKGHPKTAILSRTKRAINTTGHPGMTHGGTGDVLAGIIAALIAQGNDAFTACKIAAHVNGKAGELLAKKYGVGYLASDMILEIPTLLKKYQKIN